jgi:5-methyltetrahydrofolate--homocysteine methyltransferase
VADLEALSQAIIVGDLKKAQELTRQAVDGGVDPVAIFRDALVPGMDTVGKKMKAQEYYIPEVLLSARAMKGAAAILRPLLADNPNAQPAGRVVAGTVSGDLHDIGKNLVCMMIEGAGFEVIDLGTNVSPEKFVATAKEKGANIVALSALLTTTMVRMTDVVKAFESGGLRGQVKIMVGGAPVTQRFADEIGADGYSPDAAGAADLAKAWVA